jgi:hypothetical protein
LKEGKAVEVSFPTLSSKAQQTDREVEAFKQAVQKIESNPLYKGNDEAIQFAIAEEKAKLDAKIAEAAKEYDLELKTLEAEAAEKLFDSSTGTPEERQNAQELASIVQTQLMMTTVKTDVLEMLKAKAGRLSDGEKAALLMSFADIKQSAETNAFDHQKKEIAASLSGVYEVLSDIKPMKEAELRRKMLLSYKDSRASVSPAYDRLKLTHKAYKGGAR